MIDDKMMNTNYLMAGYYLVTTTSPGVRGNSMDDSRFDRGIDVNWMVLDYDMDATSDATAMFR